MHRIVLRISFVAAFISLASVLTAYTLFGPYHDKLTILFVITFLSGLCFITTLEVKSFENFKEQLKSLKEIKDTLEPVYEAPHKENSESDYYELTVGRISGYADNKPKVGEFINFKIDRNPISFIALIQEITPDCYLAEVVQTNKRDWLTATKANNTLVKFKK